MVSLRKMARIIINSFEEKHRLADALASNNATFDCTDTKLSVEYYIGIIDVDFLCLLIKQFPAVLEALSIVFNTVIQSTVDGDVDSLWCCFNDMTLLTSLKLVGHINNASFLETPSFLPAVGSLTQLQKLSIWGYRNAVGIVLRLLQVCPCLESVEPRIINHNEAPMRFHLTKAQAFQLHDILQTHCKLRKFLNWKPAPVSQHIEDRISFFLSLNAKGGRDLIWDHQSNIEDWLEHLSKQDISGLFYYLKRSPSLIKRY